MTEVWITHPELGSDHDIKVPRTSLGQYVQRGYAERADQSDPVAPDVAAVLAAAEDGQQPPQDVADEVGEQEPPAADEPVENDDDPEES